MCNPASFVLTKDKVFFSLKSESHQDIIEENNLHADGVRGANILACEISPLNGDLSSDPETWEFHVDEHYPVPEWFDAERDETRARSALKNWYAQKVITSGSREVRDQQIWVFGNSRVVAYGNSSVVAYDSSSVVAYDSSSVEAHDSSSVVAYGNSRVVARGSSSVEAHNSSSVKACGSSSVVACGSSSVKAYGNSRVVARGSSSVVAYGNSRVVARGSSTINVCSLHVSTTNSDKSVVIDRVKNRITVVDNSLTF